MATTVEVDREFEEGRKRWHKMQTLFATLHENLIKSTTALTGENSILMFFFPAFEGKE